MISTVTKYRITVAIRTEIRQITMGIKLSKATSIKN